jgi:outer membrane protein assembly factor BamA
MRLLLLVLALSLPGSVWAQATAQTELPAGPAPRKFVGETVVAVEFRGPSGRFREQELGYLVEQKVGAPYDPRAVRRTLELLFRLGRFENVEARAVPRVGGVALILVLEPSPIIARVELPGIRSVLPSALRGAIGGAAGEPYVPGSEARMALAAERFYRSRGFLRAKVLGRVAEAARGRRVVRLEIDEGRAYRIAGLVFPDERYSGFSPRRLIELMGPGVRRGRVFDENAASRAMERLLEGCRREGFVEARLLSVRRGGGVTAPYEVRTDHEEATVTLVIPLDAGRFVDTAWEFTGRPPDWTGALGKRRMEDVIGLEGAQRVSETYAEDAARRLSAELRRRGYYHAAVVGSVQTRPFVGGRGPEWRRPKVETVQELAFIVDRGPRVRLHADAVDPARSDIRITGTAIPSGDSPKERRAAIQARQEILDVLSEASPQVLGRSPTVFVVLGLPIPDRSFTEDEMEAAVDVLRDWERARGFLLPDISWDATLVDPADGDHRGRRVKIDLRVDPGLQTHVESLVLDTPFPLDPKLVTAWRERVEGKPYNPNDTMALRLEVLRTLAAAGHLDAEVTAEQELSEDRSLIRLTLRAVPGPLVRYGKTVVRGNRTTHAGLIRREVRMEAGDPFLLEEVEQTQTRLLRSGLFDSVSASPAQSRGAVRDLEVRVGERKRFSFIVSGGATWPDEGPRVRAEARFRNLDGRGLTFFLRGRFGFDWTDIQEAAPGCRIAIQFCAVPETWLTLGLELPYVPGVPVRGTLTGVIGEEIEDTTYRVHKSAARLGVSLWGVERVALSGRLEFGWRVPLRVDPVARLNPDADRPREDLSKFDLVPLLGGDVALDFRNDRFNPTKGVYGTVSVITTPGSLFAGSPAFGRVTGQVTGFIPFGDSGIVLRIDGRGGIAWSYDGELPPVEYRFRLGGTASIRGFALNDLGPSGERPGKLEELGLLSGPDIRARRIVVGGDAYYAYSLQVDFPIVFLSGWKFALFHDGGNAWLIEKSPTDIVTGRETMWHGTVGFGLRRVTAIGPLRLDLAFRPANFARAVDLRVGEVVQLHFAIGAL